MLPTMCRVDAIHPRTTLPRRASIRHPRTSRTQSRDRRHSGERYVPPECSRRTQPCENRLRRRVIDVVGRVAQLCCRVSANEILIAWSAQQPANALATRDRARTARVIVVCCKSFRATGGASARFACAALRFVQRPILFFGDRVCAFDVPAVRTTLRSLDVYTMTRGAARARVRRGSLRNCRASGHGCGPAVLAGQVPHGGVNSSRVSLWRTYSGRQTVTRGVRARRAESSSRERSCRNIRRGSFRLRHHDYRFRVVLLISRESV
jgi:hypothetical protein